MERHLTDLAAAIRGVETVPNPVPNPTAIAGALTEMM